MCSQPWWSLPWGSWYFQTLIEVNLTLVYFISWCCCDSVVIPKQKWKDLLKRSSINRPCFFICSNVLFEWCLSNIIFMNLFCVHVARVSFDLTKISVCVFRELWYSTGVQSASVGFQKFLGVVEQSRAGLRQTQPERW